MSKRTASETVARAIADFDDIKEAIKGHRIKVPPRTKTSEYAELIARIRVGSIAGTAVNKVNLSTVTPICGEAATLPCGTLCEIIMGNADVVDSAYG